MRFPIHEYDLDHNKIKQQDQFWDCVTLTIIGLGVVYFAIHLISWANRSFEVVGAL